MIICFFLIIYFISGSISIQCSRHTLAILRPMAVPSHKCHSRMAHARLADGSSACPRACNSCHSGEKFRGKRNRFAAAEKGLLSHGVSRGGARQCRMRPARELYAHQRQQLCPDFRKKHQQQKRFLSWETLTRPMWCSAYI